MHDDRLTDISVLQVAADFALRLDDVVRLLDEILQKLLGSYSNGKGSVVGAVVDILVCMDNLLDTGDCQWSD